LQVDHLINQLKTYKDEPINMHRAYASTTLDIIMEYSLAQCYDTISAPQFRNVVLVSLEETAGAVWLIKHFPFVFTVSQMLPEWIMVKLSPSTLGALKMKKTCERLADEVLSKPTETLHNASHEIIYHHLITSDSARRSEMPSRERLSHEARALLGAGSETVATACTVGTFHVVNDRAIWTRLRTELDEARKENGKEVTDNLGYEVLQKLPYLTAVIKEMLRLSYGLVTPLPRVVEPGDSFIAGYEVPKGVRILVFFFAFVPNIPYYRAL
jgi:cytochrome P450